MESALRVARDLKLIETFRWEPSGFVRLLAHLARMERSAAGLRIGFDGAAIARALEPVAGEGAQRVRLTLAVDGTPEVSFAPLGPAKSEWAVRVAAERLDSGDPWLRLKTTKRERYDTARAALPAGVDEALLLNERDEVCEGTITSVFVDLGEGLVTPPVACGLLPGVLRAELLANGACREAVVLASDLSRARLYVGNSLRGLISARLV
jgi:4-amino-4-deoxychorismate lyase